MNISAGLAWLGFWIAIGMIFSSYPQPMSEWDYKNQVLKEQSTSSIIDYFKDKK